MTDNEAQGHKKPGRPYQIPDPNDRSPNNPSVILSREHVLGLAPGNPETVTTEVVQSVIAACKDKGWNGGKKIGNRIVLTNGAVEKQHTDRKRKG
ncbi:MAG: hypothetical protein GDA52_07395 [Rhodobacteraceae bacterium]|nr:hypothetical protein [Paracoccaceae bacterium]